MATKVRAPKANPATRTSKDGVVVKKCFEVPFDLDKRFTDICRVQNISPKGILGLGAWIVLQLDDAQRAEMMRLMASRTELSLSFEAAK